MTLDKNEIDRRFTYYPPPPLGPQQGACAKFRDSMRTVATLVVNTCPPGRETSLAITKLEEALYWAIAAVVRPGPESPSAPVPEPPAASEPDAPFDTTAFFDAVRSPLFGGSLNQGQVDGLNLIGGECSASGLDPLVPQTAYVLATVYHETGRTMQPIEEWGKGKNKPYYPWYGRGHVQLTWEDNYRKQQDKLEALGEEYRVHDDKTRALISHVSAVICVQGMRDGDFTGKRLSDYIYNGVKDYYNARRVVNGLDRAETIAGYAKQFETALRAGVRGS